MLSEHDLINKAKSYRPTIHVFRWSLCSYETILIGTYPNGIEVHFSIDGSVKEIDKKEKKNGV